jgi:2-succinyl-6-hydroxy-2,4-cyclohexadiene-1-carboxylate synthase
MPDQAFVECVANGVRFLLWPGPATRPVVLLHGFTGAPQAWQPVVERLAGTTLIAAPYLPGHDPAASEPPHGTLLDAVDALAQALRTLYKARWRVAGYSLGGRLALALATRHAELLDSTLAIGASPGLASEAERAERRTGDVRWAQLLRERGLDEFLAEWMAQPLFASQRELPAAVLAAQRAIRARQRANHLAAALEVLGLAVMPDLRPALPRLETPLHLLVGERDDKFRALAQEIAALAPRARMTIVPGVGHNVVLEAPGSVVEAIAAL